MDEAAPGPQFGPGQPGDERGRQGRGVERGEVVGDVPAERVAEPDVVEDRPVTSARAAGTATVSASSSDT